MDKVNRIRSSSVDVAHASIWLSQNAPTLTGRKFGDIAGRVRKQFPAATLTVKVSQRIENAIGADPATILKADEKALLEQFVKRTKE